MLFCEICQKKFEPKPGEFDFLEQLFGFRGAECPKCGSFCPLREDKYKPDEEKSRLH